MQDAQFSARNELKINFVLFFHFGENVSMFYMKYEAFQINVIACILLALSCLLLTVTHPHNKYSQRRNITMPTNITHMVFFVVGCFIFGIRIYFELFQNFLHNEFSLFCSQIMHDFWYREEKTISFLHAGDNICGRIGLMCKICKRPFSTIRIIFA